MWWALAGFNRTGFILCAYLIEVCGLTVQEALDAFKAARPPGVKHEDFVEELHERYDSWKPGAAPIEPDDINRTSKTKFVVDFRSVAELLRRESQSYSSRNLRSALLTPSTGFPWVGRVKESALECGRRAGKAGDSKAQSPDGG